MWKRLLDIGVSGAALVVLAPVVLILAVAVWLDSGRPILFGQQRVGRGFQPFTLWKFRSMRTGVGSLITAAGDRRITRVGRILRRAKLDEIPQLWNVLVGEMSIVGPRPEVPEYVELFRKRYERILQVAPGLTDPATIAFVHEEDLLGGSADPEKFYVSTILPAKLDISEDYVEHASFRLDVVILIKTMLAVIGKLSVQPQKG